MNISVIATNLNGARFLPRLLESLKNQAGVRTEIIVVDRESVDDSREVLRGFPEVKVLSETPRSGLVTGYCVGLQAATSDLLFFCNEDMWLDPQCLQRLAAEVSLERRIGAADPWQWTYDEKTLIHGGTRFVESRWQPNSPHPRRTFNFTVPLVHGDLVPFPCAGAFLIHRDVYNDIGGWDTSFFLNQEDIDLFLRAWRKGWRCVTVPGAKVYHAVGASKGQFRGGGSDVAERCYIGTRSNVAVIGLKYFSLPAISWSFAGLFAPLIAHLLKFRWKELRLDLKTLILTLRRFPQVWRFRRSTRIVRSSSPGEQFFSRPEFSVQRER